MSTLICRCLEGAYRTYPAFDGKEGLAKALALRPDLILSDMQMPLGNGDDLVRAVRQKPELDSTPIVFSGRGTYYSKRLTATRQAWKRWRENLPPRSGSSPPRSTPDASPATSRSGPRLRRHRERPPGGQGRVARSADPGNGGRRGPAPAGGTEGARTSPHLDSRTAAPAFEHQFHSLSVKDTGPGISRQDRRRIFEPFEHLAPINHKHLPGVGLGLALVRELTAALGGEITLQSEPGRGSTFEVTLSTRAARGREAPLALDSLTQLDSSAACSPGDLGM
jgi:hypothetical protein